jgi:hypothetical protein
MQRRLIIKLRTTPNTKSDVECLFNAMNDSFFKQIGISFVDEGWKMKFGDGIFRSDDAHCLKNRQLDLILKNNLANFFK